MEEYTSNSKKSKDDKATGKRSSTEAPKATKVISGSVKVKKKSEFSKVVNSFIGEDIPDIKSYMLYDVIIPNIREGLYDSVGMILGVRPGRRNNNRYRDDSRKERVSFGRSNYDDRDDRRRDDDYRSRSRVGYEYEDVVLETRGDVESVFAEMEMFIDNYGQVRVADLCSMIEISSPYTGNDYGWISMDRMDFEPVRGGGYRLLLPKPKPLNDRR